jgi:hypothetical protein
MLEFGNVMRTLYGASVITSAYAASNSTRSKETETQDIIEYLNDPEFTSYQTSATGVTEAISTVQKAFDQTEAIQDDLDHIQAILEDLSKVGLTEKERTDRVTQVESYVQEIATAIEENPFLAPGGEDLVISIGNGSSITVKSQDLSISLEGVDLTTFEGLASFSETLSTQLDSVEEYGDYLGGQLDRL